MSPLAARPPGGGASSPREALAQRPEGRSAARITACVCSLSGGASFEEAVASLCRQSLDPASFEVLVVDASPEGGAGARHQHPARSAHFASGCEPRRLTQRCATVAEARNLALQACSTELIAFLGDDAVAERDWLLAWLVAFERFPDAVAAGGRVVADLGAAGSPHWLDERAAAHLQAVDHGGDIRPAGPQTSLSARSLAFRTEALKRHGGFVNTLAGVGTGGISLSNEERATLARLRAAGAVVLYVPHATAGRRLEAADVSRESLRRRVVWQAVSDFMMDPIDGARRGAAGWQQVHAFLDAMPPRHRTILGLQLDVDGPASFLGQLDALETFTLSSLAGFEGAFDG